jgi:RES domain-containing protein
VRLWRISNYADLSGLGGLRFAARWHSKGRPIVYAAEHPAGALSEFLAHMDRSDLPRSFQMLTVVAGEDASLETLPAEALPPDWLINIRATRRLGDAWLADRRSLLLRVPSALVPEADNVLINPQHPDAGKLKIVNVAQVPLDSRFGA